VDSAGLIATTGAAVTGHRDFGSRGVRCFDRLGHHVALRQVAEC